MPSLTTLAVVFIDRWAAHRLHPLIVSWRTVLIPLLSLGLQPGWFRPFQLHLFKALDGPRPLERQRPGKALRDIPKIVYVDRQLAKRALLAIHHDDLQAGLKDLESQGVATVESVRLEEMSPAAQILMVSDADVGIARNSCSLRLRINSRSLLGFTGWGCSIRCGCLREAKSSR